MNILADAYKFTFCSTTKSKLQKIEKVTKLYSDFFYFLQTQTIGGKLC